MNVNFTRNSTNNESGNKMQVLINQGLKCILCYSFLWAALSSSFILFAQTSSSKPSYDELPNAYYERLADAIYRAEGGRKASTPYGIRFKGCDWSNPAFCRQICVNTIQRQYSRYKAETRSNSLLEPSNAAWIKSLATRYCPPSVDPVGHVRWIRNVSYFLKNPVKTGNLKSRGVL